MKPSDYPMDVVHNIGMLWWYIKIPDDIIINSEIKLPTTWNMLNLAFPDLPSGTLHYHGVYKLGDWILRNTAWKVDIAARVIKLGKRPWNGKRIMQAGTRYIFSESMPKIEIDNRHKIPLIYDKSYYGTEIQWRDFPLLRNSFRVALPSEILAITGWRVKGLKVYRKNVR